jgi:hypothetical protein
VQGQYVQIDEQFDIEVSGNASGQLVLNVEDMQYCTFANNPPETPRKMAGILAFKHCNFTKEGNYTIAVEDSTNMTPSIYVIAKTKLDMFDRFYNFYRWIIAMLIAIIC